MGLPYVCYNSNIRLCYACQQSYLAFAVHSHFQHYDFMLFFQFKKGQRQSYVIVQIAMILMDIVLFIQCAINHFLRRGLAGASGNPYNQRFYLVQKSFCDFSHGFVAVSHNYQSCIRFNMFFRNNSHCSFFYCSSNEIMSVMIRTLKRNECITGFNFS